MNSFTKNPNLKKIIFFGGGGGGRGARVSELFTKNPNLRKKQKKNFLGGWERGKGGGVA